MKRTSFLIAFVLGLSVTATGQRVIPAQRAAPGSLQDFSTARFYPATVATISALPANFGTTVHPAYIIRDGSSSSDCTVGGGTTYVNCVWSGTVWGSVGGGGGGAGTVTSASFTGGLISVGTPTVTPAFTVAGSSGGIPYFSSATTWASSGALTANLPVIGGGAGVAPSVGTRSGNTTAFVTTTGSQTSGDCVKIDASGNHIANGSGCGGSGAIYQLTDFGATKTSATVLTIGTGCSASAPCLIRQGSVVYRLTSAPTATISGTSNSGTAYVYLSSAQVLTVGHNTSTTLTCSAGCTVATSISGFPTDSTPLWAVTWTANVWDAIAESMDNRALISRNVFACGTGLTCSTDPTTGIQTGSVTSSGGTYWQNFPLVGHESTADVRSFLGIAGNGTMVGLAETGPNSISAAGLGVYLLGVNQYLAVVAQAPSTWSAAAGTVDLAFTVVNREGTASGEQWQLSGYVGCAAQGAVTTYGTAKVITPSPTSTAGLKSHYEFGAMNLPAACAASVPLEFWIQRNADIVAGDAQNVAAQNVQITFRGN